MGRLAHSGETNQLPSSLFQSYSAMDNSKLWMPSPFKSRHFPLPCLLHWGHKLSSCLLFQPSYTPGFAGETSFSVASQLNGSLLSPHSCYCKLKSPMFHHFLLHLFHILGSQMEEWKELLIILFMFQDVQTPKSREFQQSSINIS